jgi:DoxX-like family
MTPRAVAYWATTGFVVFNMLSGGLAELAQLKPTAEGMQALGYPIYMMTILGTWKVLGSITLLAPRFPRLKEWAYAGMFFNMTGAAVSHLVVGDEAWHVWYTASLAIVVLVSWALRPESRTLGAPLIQAAMPAVRRTKLAGAEVPG